MAPPDRELEELLGDAMFAYTEGRFEDAFPIFRYLAAGGKPDAFRFLAQMYLAGEAVGTDVEKGIAMYRHAAELGDATSAYSLGALHRSGAYGVPRDPELSKQFFLLAKDLGCELSVDEYL